MAASGSLVDRAEVVFFTLDSGLLDKLLGDVLPVSHATLHDTLDQL